MSAVRFITGAALVVGFIGAAVWLSRGASQPLPAQGAEVVNSVTSFDRRHPEWAVLREARADEAAIRLNHARHMNPETPGMQDLLRSFADDPRAYVTLAPGSDLLSLSCASCHQPQATGRQMRPIRFESHCARCHEDQLVRIPTTTPEGPAEGVRVPHGDPERVLEQIDLALATSAAFADSRFSSPGDGDEASRSGPSRRRSGGSSSRGITVPAFANREEASHWLDAQRERFLSQAQTGCAYCHTGVTPVESPTGAFRVEPPRIPGAWLGRAQFSHQSHEMLGCLQCHTQASTSVATSDVMLPGIASCRECHNPRAGAPSNCTTCHLYHEPTPYIEGGSLSIEEFTGGSASPRP